MSYILNQELAMRSILNLIDAKHSIRVAGYAVNFARVIGLSELDIKRLEISAIWHDVGKAEISSEILNKKGKLTDLERKIIQRHTIYSEKHLLRQEYLSKCAAIAKSHHEWWDGTGYPEGLKGERIPYLARILSIVDVYDALTSERPYRKKNYSKGEALKIINEGIDS